MQDINRALSKVQKISRAVTSTRYSTKELKKEPFLKRVLKDKRVMLIGDEGELG